MKYGIAEEVEWISYPSVKRFITKEHIADVDVYLHDIHSNISCRTMYRNHKLQTIISRSFIQRKNTINVVIILMVSKRLLMYRSENVNDVKKNIEQTVTVVFG